MKAPSVMAVLVLVLLFLLIPWPLVRWAAASWAAYLVLGALWSLVLRHSLKIRGGMAKTRGFFGEKTTLTAVVENRGWLPSGLVFFFESTENLEVWGETRFFLEAAPRTRVSFDYTVRGRLRGLHSLGPLTLNACDPCGLFPFVIQERELRSFLVYPPIPGVSASKPSGFPPGDRARDDLFFSDPGRFRGFKPLEEGMELSLLSASESARQARLMVKQFDRTASLPVVVFLDFAAEHYPQRSRWPLMERAVETAAALVWKRLAEGHRVALATNGLPGCFIPPAAGWAQAAELLEALALVTPSDQKDFAVYREGLCPPPARLYWVGNRIPPELEAAYPGYQTVFLHIGDGTPYSIGTPREVRIPDYGEIPLEGL